MVAAHTLFGIYWGATYGSYMASPPTRKPGSLRRAIARRGATASIVAAAASSTGFICPDHPQHHGSPGHFRLATGSLCRSRSLRARDLRSRAAEVVCPGTRFKTRQQAHGRTIYCFLKRYRCRGRYRQQRWTAAFSTRLCFVPGVFTPFCAKQTAQAPAGGPWNSPTLPAVQPVHSLRQLAASQREEARREVGAATEAANVAVPAVPQLRVEEEYLLAPATRSPDQLHSRMWLASGRCRDALAA